MSGLALAVRGLGKRYRTGLGGRTGQEFRALDDVSFELERGASLGVLGRNGAGKTTLLKILTRITAPSAGEFEAWGRVVGLLEVGAGFHPELTGRENVFLNAALHGMSRAETERRFEAIVGFAGVEGFVDTPMKRYSTGMYVRLAFAVAAHLDADILLVDEVLSVGDAEFRARSLGRLAELRQAGRALVFVSHDLEALRSLCPRALLLEGGCLIANDPVEAALTRYLGSADAARYAPVRRPAAQIVSAELRDPRGLRVSRFVGDEAVVVRAAYVLPDVRPGLRLAVLVRAATGALLFASDTRDAGLEAPAAPGEHALELRLPPGLFEPGAFQVGLSLWDAGEKLDTADAALHFEVEPGRAGESSDPLRPRGALRVACEWNVALPEASLVP
jgi:ABC-type polysaccharide/polyol phosphate transport system ATPase subunit